MRPPAPPEAPKEEPDSGDETENTGDAAADEEIELWLWQTTLAAAAQRLASEALEWASDLTAATRASLRGIADEAIRERGVDRAALEAETRRMLLAPTPPNTSSADETRTGPRRHRPLAAAALAMAATAEGDDGRQRACSTAAALVRTAARSALRFATLPSAPSPGPRTAAAAQRLADDLEASLSLSQAGDLLEGTLVGFARPKLVREVAAARRALALCCDQRRREVILSLLLRHPPPTTTAVAKPASRSSSASSLKDETESSPTKKKDAGGSALNAAAAAAIAARHGDVDGWERLQSTDRHGAERLLEGKPLGEFLLRPQQPHRKAGSSGNLTEESAAVAISFVAARASAPATPSKPPRGADSKSAVQHAIIRVAADGEGGVKYTSGKLGPCPTLLSILEEISKRLEPHGLLIDGVRRRELDDEQTASAPPADSGTTPSSPTTKKHHRTRTGPIIVEEERLNEDLDRAFRDLLPKVFKDEDDDPHHEQMMIAAHQPSTVGALKAQLWELPLRTAATLDVMSSAALQQQLRNLYGSGRQPCRDAHRGAAAVAAIYDRARDLDDDDDDDADDAPGLVTLARTSRSLTRQLLSQLTPALLDATGDLFLEEDQKDQRPNEKDEEDDDEDASPTTKKRKEEDAEKDNDEAFDRKTFATSFSEVGASSSVVVGRALAKDDPVKLHDGYILAQMLHPRSGVALLAPKAALSSWSSANATLVAACFAPEAAAHWLVEHGHDATAALAKERLAKWRARRIVTEATPTNVQHPGSPTPGSPRKSLREVKSEQDFAASSEKPKVRRFRSAVEDDAQLRYVDPWEVEPLDDDDPAVLLRESVLGRLTCCPVQGDDGDDVFLYNQPPSPAAAATPATPETPPTKANSNTDAPMDSPSDHSSGPLLHLRSPWSRLRCDAWLATAIAQALTPAARAGEDECFGGEDEALADACSPWPPPPAASNSNDYSASEPFRSRLRRYLYRNALFRRAKMRRRFIAVVQVDLVALENISESLVPGSGGGGQDQGASVSPRTGRATAQQQHHRGDHAKSGCGDAYAVLRLKHSRPPGSGSSPPLTERVRTRDSAVARRRSAEDHHHHRVPENYWGVSAAFRFALPDEALPPDAEDDDDDDDAQKGASPPPSNSEQTSVRTTSMASSSGGDVSPRKNNKVPQQRRGPTKRRLPTRGPPQAVHICVYQRLSNPILASFGLAPTENFLGDVEVPLTSLTEDESISEWLPLRNLRNDGSWFVKVKVCLRFLLMSTTDNLVGPAHHPRSARRFWGTRRLSTFSDHGDLAASPLIPRGKSVGPLISAV